MQLGFFGHKRLEMITAVSFDFSGIIHGKATLGQLLYSRIRESKRALSVAPPTANRGIKSVMSYEALQKLHLPGTFSHPRFKGNHYLELFYYCGICCAVPKYQSHCLLVCVQMDSNGLYNPFRTY